MNFQRQTANTFGFALLVVTFVGGCVAPYVAPNAALPDPPVTYWNKLGIPQAGAGLRDNFLNRRGNFPRLEAKPPVLRLADPRNLAEGQPQMIQSAAKIKMAEDMKKQKLKALKYLADINCGCYNNDGKVEAAFLEALADCDPDVRLAAVEGLANAASCSSGEKKNCLHCKDRKKGLLKGKDEEPSCCDGCRTTCCTRKLQDKLQEIAYGMTDDGCYKEPVMEIRCAAEQLLCACPPAPIEPEELVRPDAWGPEELARPDAVKKPDNLKIEEGKKPAEDTQGAPPAGQSMRLTDSGIPQYVRTPRGVGVSLSDDGLSVPSVLSGNRSASLNPSAGTPGNISNPDLLVACETVKHNQVLGELLVEMPYASQLQSGWDVVVLDSAGAQHFGTISDVGGRRVLITLNQASGCTAPSGSTIRFGVVSQ